MASFKHLLRRSHAPPSSMCYYSHGRRLEHYRGRLHCRVLLLPVLGNTDSGFPLAQTSLQAYQKDEELRKEASRQKEASE